MKLVLDERARARRNLDPHAPARAAMWLFGKRYAAQNGGSMDFWDSLDRGDKRMARDCAEQLRNARPMTAREISDENDIAEKHHQPAPRKHAMARKPRIITEVETFLLDEVSQVAGEIGTKAVSLGSRLRNEYHGGSANKTKPKRTPAKKAKSKTRK